MTMSPLKNCFALTAVWRKEKNEFLSAEVIEQAQAIAYNYMVEELNKTFKKMQRSLNRSKGLIKIKWIISH